MVQMQQMGVLIIPSMHPPPLRATCNDVHKKIKSKRKPFHTVQVPIDAVRPEVRSATHLGVG